MLAFLDTIWHQSIVKTVVIACFLGAVAGLLSAARVDYEAFQSWQTVDDAKKYSWKMAFWRWFRGSVVGAVSATSAALSAAGVGHLFGIS